MKKDLPRHLPATIASSLPAKREVRDKISKLKNVGKMRSILGDSAEAIQQLLEVGDNDSATALIYKKSLQTIIDSIPYAEATIRRTKGARGVYQLNSLISSMREVMIDLQNMQDRGAIGDSLVEKIIRPSFLDVGMHIVQEYASVAADAKNFMAPDDWKAYKQVLAKSRGSISEFIQREYGKVKEDSRAFLGR